MKQLKTLVILAMLALTSGFAFAQNTSLTTATEARDSIRTAKDALDEARAALAAEEKAITTAQKAVADEAVAARPAAQKAVDDRKSNLTIAKKRLAQAAGCDVCGAPTQKAPAKKATAPVAGVSTHEVAALKARIIALEQTNATLRTSAQATASASATANASANASALVTASAFVAATPVGQTKKGSRSVSYLNQVTDKSVSASVSTDKEEQDWLTAQVEQCTADQKAVVTKVLEGPRGQGMPDAQKQAILATAKCVDTRTTK